MHKLLHRYLDIPSQTNRVLSAPVIESIEEPEEEEVADVLGFEAVLVVDEGVGHAQGHAAVVRPDPHLPCPGIQESLVDGICYVLEAFLDDGVALLDEGGELSTGSECVTDGEAKQ